MGNHLVAFALTLQSRRPSAIIIHLGSLSAFSQGNEILPPRVKTWIRFISHTGCTG